MVVPLLVLAATYSLIIRTLWKGIKTERGLRPSGKKHVFFRLTCIFLIICFWKDKEVILLYLSTYFSK